MGQSTVQLLRDVEKYLKTSNTPAARFGREAMGDPRFVFDLRRGREPLDQLMGKEASGRARDSQLHLVPFADECKRLPID